MCSNRKQSSFNFIWFLAVLGMYLGRDLPPYVQVVLTTLLVVFLVVNLMKDLKTKKWSNEPYIYVFGLALGSVYIIYLICENYLKLGSSGLFEWILVILIILLILIAAQSKLRSKDIQKMKEAKVGLVFIGVSIILIILVFIGYLTTK